MSERSILRDVAQAAGVSLRTASRVLNDDPRVAEATRARVRQVMHDLDYTPDSMARSLRAGTDASIGLVVESVADPFFAELAAAVESVASDDGRSVVIASTHRDPERERRVLQQMLQRRVSGLLLVPTGGDHGWLAETAPLVLVDRGAAGLDVDVVGIDDRQAAFDAVSHLISHGHRDIAYVGDQPQIATSAARLAGYRAAMEHHGLAVRAELVRANCPASREAAAATADLLALERPPTALLSAATRCSLGVVPTLHVHRRTDIALVGFGDFAMADTLDPAVTVVDHSATEVGVAAAERLRKRVADPQLPVETVHVPVRLVRRGSGELLP